VWNFGNFELIYREFLFTICGNPGHMLGLYCSSRGFSFSFSHRCIDVIQSKMFCKLYSPQHRHQSCTIIPISLLTQMAIKRDIPAFRNLKTILRKCLGNKSKRFSWIQPKSFHGKERNASTWLEAVWLLYDVCRMCMRMRLGFRYR